ncbi:hypothetical protein [Rhodobacter calidifons]|uniref:Uncharacterized protein n=1 Tax=Rhodobacter calidifons TaxID=2715277 RepID=A0ABX0G2E3_9RHOB|nr:hypothetical protein [Rhodobacter calidifons]NHB75383.1 hypothetical protein [Rhodobacter calidifons]
MRHASLAALLDRPPTGFGKGPVALILAEDGVELDSTLDHHLKIGFRDVVLLAPEGVEVHPEQEGRVHIVRHDVFAEGALVAAVNRAAAALPGRWIYYCHNAEYLFFPFCETRRVGEMLAFHAEERREAMLTYVIDLYAGDLGAAPDAVSLEDAWLDRTGYYALARKDPANDWQPKDRQLDFHGGLRWRFEEHIPYSRRRIDRISLFRAKPGVTLRPDFTLTEEEMNTYSCRWHNNLTAAVCSFRTAKALRTNPGSRHAIQTFRWPNSVRFDWNSRQLMDLGLMEPGQWF